MSSSLNLQNKIKKNDRPKFIGRNFDDFRNQLLNYARNNFSNEINDFSEASLGGMLLDFASFVGESTSFYIDQQMAEMDYELATNPDNIQKHIRRAGINNISKSNSVLMCRFYMNVPVDITTLENEGVVKPIKALLPKIMPMTKVESSSNITFVLYEEVDFSLEDYVVSDVLRDEDDIPQSLLIYKEGICYSGEIATETASFQSDSQGRFLSYQLENEDVVEILSVIDDLGEEYYEVEYLSQDTVYKSVKNENESYYQLMLAPKRFVVERDITNNITSLRFGNGEGTKLKTDVLTDLSDIALPVKGRNYMTRYSLDPNKLLNSRAFGISPAGNTLTITYRYGGGSNHNIEPRQLQSIIDPVYKFDHINELTNITAETRNILTSNVIDSMYPDNVNAAVGGSEGLSLEEARYIIPTMMKMQNRVVNIEDLLARIYTMPTNFGKVHKASVEKNKFSNSSKDIFIVCKDKNGYLKNANDALKLNISDYLNELRIIGDELNIVDAPIINYKIDLSVKVKENLNINDVLDEVYENIVEFYPYEDMNIGQGINVNNILNIVLNTQGVISVTTPIEDIIKIVDETSNGYSYDLDEDLVYSSNRISVYDSIEDGIIYPPTGGIFELKYLISDIKIRN
jgi:hypothetical protein